MVDLIEKPELDIPTEWTNAQGEIFGRYLLYWDALNIAYGPPVPDANLPGLEDLLTERAYKDVVAEAEQLKADGIYVVLPENSVTDHMLRLTSSASLEKVEGKEVIIQDCFVDDAEYRTFDGELARSFYTSSLLNVTMRVIDGEWRVASAGDADDQSDGYEECKEYINQL